MIFNKKILTLDLIGIRVFKLMKNYLYFFIFIFTSAIAGNNIGQTQAPAEAGVNPFKIIGDLIENAADFVENQLDTAPSGQQITPKPQPNQTVNWKYPNGDTFKGETDAEGNLIRGEYTYSSGDRYIGEIKNNNFHGRAEYIFANGDRYVGDFVDSFRHGKGEFFYKNGNRYKGDFVKGKIDGQGEFNFANGDRYLGSFKQDLFDGNGEYHYTEGGKYIGNWKEHSRFGYGEEFYLNGDIYKGEHKNNEQTGEGKFIGVDGITMSGNFERGLLIGSGRIEWSDGSYLEGNFIQGVLEGHGLTKYSDSFDPQAAIKNSAGTLNVENFSIDGKLWQPGTEYVGNFKNQFKHGEGKVTLSSGEKFKVTCEFGKCISERKVAKKIPKSSDETVKKKIEPAPKQDETYAELDLEEIDVEVTDEKSKEPVKIIAEADSFKDDLLPEINVSPVKEVKENIKDLVPIGSGTGFAVSNDGYLVTNNHVIKGCRAVIAASPVISGEANILDIDEKNDLALLKVNFKPTGILNLSKQPADLMEDIYVAGYPFGLNVSKTIKITKGIVSSLSGIGHNDNQIQIDAAIQPGNSGGPIIDIKGNVVGVAVSKLDPKYAIEAFGVIPENVNFGVKPERVQDLLLKNKVKLTGGSNRNISQLVLKNKIVAGTYYLDCLTTKKERDKLINKNRK